MQRSNEWILCASKSFPGKFYYFNTRNRETAWRSDDAETTAGRLPETPIDFQNHENPRRSLPTPDSLQQDPEVRHRVTTLSAVHQPTSPLHLNVCPQGLPQPEESNIITTPIQIQLRIPVQNQTNPTFRPEYQVFRNNPNIFNAERSNAPRSINGFKFIVPQTDYTESKILVHASNIPTNQRFVNFEAPSISFGKINKDNIKRLHQKLKLCTPRQKSRSLEDPRLQRVSISKSSLNFAETGNSFINEQGLSSKTNSQVLNVRRPTRWEPINQNLNVRQPFTSNGSVLPQYSEPLFTSGLPSKMQEGKSKTVVNFDPPLIKKEPDVNLGTKSVEPSYQFLNVGPSLETKELSSKSTELPSKSTELPSKPTELPSKPTEKEIEKEPKECVKSLKSCVKGYKGYNEVPKSFDDDLRAIISKRKSKDIEAEFEGTKPKVSKQETPAKKKVTFNLDHDSVSMVSSLVDDDDVKRAFTEQYRPTASYLRSLGAVTLDSWCILADAEVLIEDIDFIVDFVLIDPSCKLLIPCAVHEWLVALARGSARARATAARTVLRRTNSPHVIVQASNNQDKAACSNDAILRCCKESMDQNKHLVLISNDLELLMTAKSYPIPCFSMNSIKNGLPVNKSLIHKKNMNITITNSSSLKDELNEKEKAIIRNARKSVFPGQNDNLKETKQNGYNGNLAEKIQNGQTVTKPTEKTEQSLKSFYHNESMRIANAIEIHIDSQNPVKSSRISTNTNGISNNSTIQNECMNINRSCRSIEIVNKTIESTNERNYNKEKKTADFDPREMTQTTTGLDCQEINIKEEDTTVSVFFNNQKPIETQKLPPNIKAWMIKNNITETSEENNIQKETKTDNETPNFKNNPRTEVRKSNESIFEFCKEKTKEPQSEFENRETNMASQYDRTKSNMASTANGFNVAKAQTIMHTIDLNRCKVTNKDMEHRLKARMEEWVCFYCQVVEDSLTCVLQKQSPPELNPPAPWSLFETLQCIDSVYEEHKIVNKIVSTLLSCLYERGGKMKKFIHPDDFMRALGCGFKLLELLKIILPSILEIQDGWSALETLLNQIEDDSDPTAGLSEPCVNFSLNSRPDEPDLRQNYVKDKSDVAEYLRKHFPAWKDYDPSKDFVVIRTRGKNVIKLEMKDKRNAIDRNGVLSNFDVTSIKISDNKTSEPDYRNNHFEDKIDIYTPNEVKEGTVQDKKGPKIIRNVRVLHEFETKLKKEKRKTKLVNEIIKPPKKKKCTNNAKVNGEPKNTVTPLQIDPKLILSPKVVIKPNPIIDYYMRKAQKIYDSQTKDNNNYPTKADKNKPARNTHNYYYNNNNNHTITKNHKQMYHDNDNQVTNIKNKKNNHDNYDNYNHNDDNDNHIKDNDNHIADNDNHIEYNDVTNKDVTTDSGLGHETPRWSSVVDSFTPDIEKYLQNIVGNIERVTHEETAVETVRMRAFETDYLISRILGTLHTLLQQSTDEDDRARNVDAVKKYMAQAESTHQAVNSILALTSYVLPPG